MSYTFLLERGEESSAESFSAMIASAPWKPIHTAGKFCFSDSATESCPGSPSGTTSAPLTETRGAASLTSSPEDSPAKASASPAEARDSTTRKADSGASRRESLATFDRQSCGWKTRQRLLFEAGCESLATLPRWGMTVAGELYPLPTPSGLTAHRASITSASASGFTENVPTPTKSMMTQEDMEQAKFSGSSGNRPTYQDAKRLPIPLAGDATGSRGSKGRNRPDEGGLLKMIQRIPSPKSEDGQCSGGHRDKDDTLYGLICRPKRMPTPTKQDGSNNCGPSQKDRHALNVKIGGELNPPWVEWFMGWPIGWTDLKPLAMDKFLRWLSSHGKY